VKPLESKNLDFLLCAAALCCCWLPDSLFPLSPLAPPRLIHRLKLRPTSLAKLRRAFSVCARVGRVVGGAAGRRGRRGRGASDGDVGGRIVVSLVVVILQSPSRNAKAGPAGEGARGRARLRVPLHLRPCGLAGEGAERERERGRETKGREREFGSFEVFGLEF